MKLKVSVLGAGGEIGKILTILLKEDKRISHLSLYDIVNMGMSVDASYVPTETTVSGHRGPSVEALEECVKDSDIVVLIAGMAWRKGLTRGDMFQKNAEIVKTLLLTCIKICPKAHVLVITNPVNSIVPLAYNLYKKMGIESPSIFGITTLDIVRAKIIVGNLHGISPDDVDVDVVGGHSDETMIPLLSSIKKIQLNQNEIKEASKRIVNCVYEVANAKENIGTASLSMAYALRIFIDDLILSFEGKTGRFPLIAYVKNSDHPSGYFSSRIVVGQKGLERCHPLPELSKEEKEMYEKAITVLKKEVQLGIDWVSNID